MHTKSFLRRVRREALKKRVWFRVLDRVECGIFNLVVSVLERVESTVLGSVLVRIIAKIRDAMKGDFVKMFEKVGIKRAYEFAGYASMWGYGKTYNWLDNHDFARYLTVQEFYTPTGNEACHG
jgi:hypothetical protein